MNSYQTELKELQLYPQTECVGTSASIVAVEASAEKEILAI